MSPQPETVDAPRGTYSCPICARPYPHSKTAHDTDRELDKAADRWFAKSKVAITVFVQFYRIYADDDVMEALDVMDRVVRAARLSNLLPRPANEIEAEGEAEYQKLLSLIQAHLKACDDVRLAVQAHGLTEGSVWSEAAHRMDETREALRTAAGMVSP